MHLTKLLEVLLQLQLQLHLTIAQSFNSATTTTTSRQLHLLFFTSTLQIFMGENSVNKKLINCSNADADVDVAAAVKRDKAFKSIFKNELCLPLLNISDMYIHIHIYIFNI